MIEKCIRRYRDDDNIIILNDEQLKKKSFCEMSQKKAIVWKVVGLSQQSVVSVTRVYNTTC